MHCKEVQAVLIEYLDQSLDTGVAAVVKKHLASCPACQQEAGEMQQLLLAMKDTAMQQPGQSLRDNFQTLLQSEMNMLSMSHLLEDEEKEKDAAPAPGQGKPAVLSRLVWQAAAAFLLLLGGAWVGATLQHKKDDRPNEMAVLQKEVKEMKQMLLFSLIDDESASQRIKAVSYAEELSNPDEPVIDALINSLNNDKNANVRLAALYSLARWADRATVRDSLVVSLGRQTEPIVQIVLINLLAEKRETRAIPSMKAILSNDKALKEVKDAAQKGLRVL
ncbi:MAG: HEAT repeat domain-containing protein [Bacteroidetes bacterium]|nr:HEAT repeat domain-containing protein [Bacteroidota bacterium]